MVVPGKVDESILNFQISITVDDMTLGDDTSVFEMNGSIVCH